MSKATIHAGICGFKTEVTVHNQGKHCTLTIHSDCGDIQKLADRLKKVDPYREISFKGDGPLTFKSFKECCLHPACPVPAGIIKAIEVEAGLALPMDVSIEISKENE
jgi:hypothetical protein